MPRPSQSYAVDFSCFLHPLAGVVPRGYGLTLSQDGSGYVIATTANLAVSASGTIDGVSLAAGVAYNTIPVQKDAEVFPENCPWLGAGAVEDAVVDANGKVQRASVATGITIGTVTKNGAVKLRESGSVGVASLLGDVVGPITATALVMIAALAGGGTRAVTVDNSGDISAQSFQAAPTGSGFWHTTSNALDATVSRGTANQVAVTNGAGTDTTWATTGGDVTGPITALVVGKLQGAITLSGTPTAGQALVATSGTAATWTTIGGGVTYGNDLDVTSTSGNQIVDSLTGSAGIVLVRGTAALQFGSTSPAASGLIRTAKNVTVVAARLSSGLGDLTVLQVDASDQVYVGTTLGGFVAAPVAGSVYAYAGGVARVTVNGSTGMVTMSNGLTVSGLAGSGNRIVLADNTGVLSAVAGGSAGNVLTYNGTTWISSAPSGGGSPGGSNTQMQYNNAGAFGGTAEFTYASSKLGVSSAGAITFGTTPATTAYLRFDAAATMIAFWGGAANVVAMAADGSNNLYVGGTALGTTEATNLYLQSGGAVNLRSGSTTYLSVTSTTTTFSGSAFNFGAGVIQHGASPAGSGDFRVKTGWLLNGLATTDRTLLTLDASGFMGIGGTTSLGSQVTIAYLQATNNVYLVIGAAAVFGVQSGNAFVASGDNFSVGTQSPTMNSATNTIFLTNGLGASAGPTSGTYVASNSGLFTFWNSAANSGSGGTTKMRISFKRWITGTPAAADRKLGIVLEDGSEWFIPLSTT